MTDYGARWAKSFPTKDMKAETVDRMLSDQGKSFLSEVVAEVCEYFKTKKINSTLLHSEIKV